jgi:hypothetical protein
MFLQASIENLIYLTKTVFESDCMGGYKVYSNVAAPSQGVLAPKFSKANGRVTLRAYLPVNFELCLWRAKAFSHMAIAYNAKLGAAFQIILNEGINPRFFARNIWA